MTASVPTTTPGQVSDFYDVYNSLLRKYWDDNFHFGYWLDADDGSSVSVATDRFTDIMISKLPVGPGARILDVGCGIGKPAIRLARATGASVLGISINQNQVDEANALAAAEGLADRVSFQVVNALDMPFDDGSFDAALAFESIVHMPRKAALSEIARVVRPGGHIALTDLIRVDAEESTSPAAFMTQSVVRLEDYRELCRDAGIEIDELLDVSAHTDRTYDAMQNGIERSSEEISGKFGPGMMETLKNVMTPFAMGNVIGCAIVAGRRKPVLR
ncbi:27-O-demethylrifamycin SV methyltransferase [Cryptosporangium japonicum]|uniref:27-O-demethylrifamycin SV methyltransferase n=2 Tax=Cryptosporangium japonicum TaxID=80872 RepID=A0ABP3D5D4_9ACTN